MTMHLNSAYRWAVITKLRQLRTQKEGLWRRLKEADNPEIKKSIRELILDYAFAIKEIEDISRIAGQYQSGERPLPDERSQKDVEG